MKGTLIEFIWDVLGIRDMRPLEPEQLNVNIRRVQEVLMPLLKRLKVVYSPKHPLYARNTTAGLPKRFGIAGITKVGADRYKFSIADPARNTSHHVSVAVRTYLGLRCDANYLTQQTGVLLPQIQQEARLPQGNLRSIEKYSTGR